MPDDVKTPKRAYDSSRRQARAAEAQAAILRAARDAFLTDGYAATTVPGVAKAASVSVETVYKAFGNKAGLVKAVFDVAIVGDDEPIPLMQRELIAQIEAESDPRKKFERYGAHLAEIASRTQPIVLVVRAAAVTDEGAAAVWDQLQAERLMGMTAFAGHLHDAGCLRDGVSKIEARDVLWTYNSVEVWDLLVNQRGWATKRYGRFVAQQLIAALV
jgi:AcrR family transcriptional regulator